ncbi:MAG: PhnD/SsuA/transferrin family substrate-binding protein [Spirochaetales bacterium]|nr:PhnD/SsuA/transferrin family substrate-binding protein [Spirochaetales bacterium]
MKTRFLAVLTLLLLCLSIYAGGSQEESSTSAGTEAKAIERSVLVIAAPRSPASLPVLWLQENKPSEDFPDVKVELYSSMEAMMALAQSDDVDLMLMPSNSAATMYNKGFNVSLLNVFQWGGLFLSSTDPDCNSWEDLKGKELYVPSKGSVPDMVTQLFLKNNNLTIGSDLTVVYSNHAEIAQLLGSGTISYAVDVQPFVTANSESLANYHIISEYRIDWKNLAGEGVKMPGFCTLIKGNSCPADPEMVNRAFETAVKTIAENQQMSGELANKYINANANLIAKSISGFNFSFMAASDITADVNKYLELLYSMKPAVVGGKMPDEGFLYSNDKE